MKVKYNLKFSKRAKYMRLEVKRNGELVVTLPEGMDYGLVERFINQKSEWIKNALGYFNSVKGNPPSHEASDGQRIFLNTSKREYVKYKEKARLLAESRVAYYNML